MGVCLIIIFFFLFSSRTNCKSWFLHQSNMKGICFTIKIVICIKYENQIRCLGAYSIYHRLIFGDLSLFYIVNAYYFLKKSFTWVNFWSLSPPGYGNTYHGGTERDEWS